MWGEGRCPQRHTDVGAPPKWDSFLLLSPQRPEGFCEKLSQTLSLLCTESLPGFHLAQCKDKSSLDPLVPSLTTTPTLSPHSSYTSSIVLPQGLCIGCLRCQKCLLPDSAGQFTHQIFLCSNVTCSMRDAPSSLYESAIPTPRHPFPALFPPNTHCYLSQHLNTTYLPVYWSISPLECEHHWKGTFAHRFSLIT